MAIPVFGQIGVLPSGSATDLPIAFGDGDSGFYESADDVIRIALAGAERFIYTTTQIRSSEGAGFAAYNETATATNPTLAPNNADADTGIGWNSADNLSLISGGAEAVRIEDPADLGASETSLWLYDDDNGVIQQVSVGADDTGGGGFKVLRIAN